jgi:uncharacterized membrane protein
LYEVTKFLHLSAGLIWLGGMTTLLWAVRPTAVALLEPPVRIPLLTGVLTRFFALVGLCIAALLVTGGWMLADVDMKVAPKGWHAMLGLGLLMCLVFGHLYFVPFRRLKKATALSDWPAAAQQLAKIHTLVVTNFMLGWLAVAAVVIWR